MTDAKRPHKPETDPDDAAEPLPVERHTRRRFAVVSAADTLDPELLARIHRRAGHFRERVAETRAHRCPTCTDPTSPTARTCALYGETSDDHDVDFAPACKWHAHAAESLRLAAAAAVRLERLVASGCHDPEILETLPTASTPPSPDAFLADPAEGKGARDAMRSAVGFLRSSDAVSLLGFNGSPGSGKSLAAGWIVAGTASGTFWLSATTVDRFDEWREVEQRAHACGLLVLDDLGEERQGTEWGATKLAHLVVDRFNRGRRTVITSNLSREDLFARYGDRFASRASSARARFVGTGEIDLRVAKRKHLATKGSKP